MQQLLTLHVQCSTHYTFKISLAILYLLFSKLFAEMTCIFCSKLLSRQISRSILIEQSPELHPCSIFLVRLIIETQCIIFHHFRVNCLAIH